MPIGIAPYADETLCHAWCHSECCSSVTSLENALADPYHQVNPFTSRNSKQNPFGSFKAVVPSWMNHNATRTPTEAPAGVLRWGKLGHANQLVVLSHLSPIHMRCLCLVSRRMRKRVLDFMEDQVKHPVPHEGTLIRSLKAVNFTTYGGNLWSHNQTGITVQLKSDGLVAWVPSVSDDDVLQWLQLQLTANPDCSHFGQSLLDAAENFTFMAGAQADADPAAKEESGDAPDGDLRSMARLPSVVELAEQIGRAISTDRDLVIYTWGDKLKTKAAIKQLGSQFDINAKPLNGRGRGADTKYNALQDRRIMQNVASSMSEGNGLLLLSQAIKKIEAEDLSIISVFCSKGRHRSVSCAELLRMQYYPMARIAHLTIS